jgi:hypothetical protein
VSDEEHYHLILSQFSSDLVPIIMVNVSITLDAYPLQVPYLWPTGRNESSDILVSTPMPAPYTGQCLCGGCKVFIDVEPVTTLGVRLTIRAQISILMSVNDRAWVSVTAMIAPIAVVQHTACPYPPRAYA